MDDEYRSLASHGNMITMIHCRQKIMFTKRDFCTLLDSENIEDICVKLQHQYPEVVGMSRFTRSELKKKLEESLMREIRQGMKEPSALQQISFFIENYKIQNFFFLLSCKEYDAELETSFAKIESLGYFNELDTLKFCANMDEVLSFCVKNTFLADYCAAAMFKKCFGDNNFSIINTQVRKKHIERYAKSASDNFLRLLRLEGDKHNLDIVLSTMGADVAAQQRLAWMTPVTNFSQIVYKSIADAADIDDLHTALGATRFYKTLCEDLKEKDLSSIFQRKEIDAYLAAFDIFNDVTSLYAYLKLREQEIKNILWVAECVISGKKDTLDELLIPLP